MQWYFSNLSSKFKWFLSLGELRKFITLQLPINYCSIVVLCLASGSSTWCISSSVFSETWKGLLSIFLKFFTCIVPSPQYSVQQILATTLSFKLSLCLLTSPNLLDSSWVLLPLPWPVNYLQAESLNNGKGSSHLCSSSQRSQSCFGCSKYLNAMVAYILTSFLVV